MRARDLLALLSLALAATSTAQVDLVRSHAPRRLTERFRLFPELVEPLPAFLIPVGDDERMFHEPGDPDARFSFGGSSPQGRLRLKASFEVNDVVLRALGPDLRITPSDPRGRAQGDYRALDANGRPYQLRLGARLVW